MAKFELVSGGGSIAKRLLKSGMNVNALRTNTTLSKDEWVHFDKAIVKEYQRSLVGVKDLYAAGLVYRLNGMAKTVMEYQKTTSNGSATMSMNGLRRGEKFRTDFDLGYLPLPITHGEYSLDARTLASSRSGGVYGPSNLDTTLAEEVARTIAEFQETMLFQGASSYGFGGGVLYGYTDFPSRNTVSLGTAWTSETGANILAKVLAMKQEARDARQYGPYVLYIPSDYATVMDKEFTTGYPKTIRARLLEIEGISAIKVSEFLPADNVLLIQMTSNNVRWVEGLPLTNLEWDTEGGLNTEFKVMTIGVPQLRTDANGRSGIVHAA